MQPIILPSIHKEELGRTKRRNKPLAVTKRSRRQKLLKTYKICKIPSLNLI